MLPKEFLPRWWPVLLLAAYLPLLWTGPGSDNNSYGVIRTGTDLLTNGVYHPSRPPSYFLYESLIGLLAVLQLLPLAGNIISFAAAVLVVVLAGRLLEKQSVPRNRINLYLFALIASPYFIINATSSMDYMLALVLMLYGFLLLLDNNFAAAGIALGLSIAFRGSGVVLIATLFAADYLVARGRSCRGAYLRAGTLAVLTAGLFYIPGLLYYRGSAILKAGVGGAELWTVWARIGRFGYKNVYYWGLPGAIMIALILLPGLLRHRNSLLSDRPLAGMVAIVLANQLLFLKYPIELGYLLPCGVFTMLICARLQPASKWWPVGLTVALGLYGLISINVARPNVARHATGATFGIHLERGALLNDVRKRMFVRGCTDDPCWYERMPLPVLSN